MHVYRLIHSKLYWALRYTHKMIVHEMYRNKSLVAFVVCFIHIGSYFKIACVRGLILCSP